jgi:serine/threonine protein kinase
LRSKRINLTRSCLALIAFFRSLEHALYHVANKMVLKEKVQILLGIATGLSELHNLTHVSMANSHIVHGDIKPANILLSGQNPPTVKLADFGMSEVKTAVQAGLKESMIRQTFSTKGTPVYSAPEILPGARGRAGSVHRGSDV